MKRRKSYVIVALFGLLLLTEIVIAESDGGKGNGNNGKGNEGKVEKRKGGDDVKGKGNGNGPKGKDKNKNDKGKKDKDKKGRIRRKTRSRVKQLLVTSVPPKTGVPRPVMGGEDKYQTPSLFSPTCRLCRFKPHEESLSADI
ncbi:hypothetical protein YC2023_021799 [Brassica napus]